MPCFAEGLRWLFQKFRDISEGMQENPISFVGWERVIIRGQAKIWAMSRFLVLLLAALLILPVRAQTLVGFARFPANSFVPGPTSGQRLEVKDGLVALPFQNKQPIQGFSSLWRLSKTEFLALEDNGYGAKGNSDDFLLRVVRVKVDFKTPKGGAGTVRVVSSVELKDPKKLVNWPLVRADRQLTGADFDPESLVVTRDKTWWLGDEFGPFLLHFNAEGELLEAPFALSGVASPDDPLGRQANIKSSRGFEGLGLWPNQLYLYPLLEGALNGDDPNRLPMYQFDLYPGLTTFHSFSAPPNFYQLEPVGPDEKPHSIGECVCVDYGKFLINERDDLGGDSARFKRVYLWDQYPNSKTLVADLLNILDPNGLGPSQKGIYRMQFQTIESVVMVDKRHLLLCNDNNYPFGRGRGADHIEDTEFVLLELDKPLF
ncbi:hypothetical protein IAD21_02104 [Abditibacteriota bacterium]|nr:hypothetical protein IAD21_02104 [Abditibacteriota bacterium]